jgi:hypothetical protein
MLKLVFLEYNAGYFCWRDTYLSEESAATNFKPEEWLHFTFSLLKTEARIGF